MPPVRTPTPTGKRYAIDCPPLCGLHPDKIGAEAAQKLLRLKEKGLGVTLFSREGSSIVGRTLQEGAVSRHLKHYKELAGALEAPVDAAGAQRKASDVEILDAVIQRAWENRASWKPSLRDMLEAMAKKHAITGGSEASDLMRLFDDAALDEEEPAENPEAALSPDERPTEDSDDLADG